ncbi:hypothetical protein KHA90_06295 [Flavobacterium psychroterrae]|uniref:Uncharacterized protein n=1 Tax=Flavobacterium psychroterrae TaxID=2133767 RepID=A0ABS5P8K1_9FLAO|nr:hypothetical protein [Flavobacterium psychroterrae]MBS7230627.1 hypothetical protein [Flavobacterium psychroterrae]
MEIEIVENKKQSLYAYKNNELLFYSTGKFNWYKTIIKVYNYNDDLVLNLESKVIFINNSYKILFQNENLLNNILGITDSHLFFDKNKSLKKNYNDRLFSINWNYHYTSEETKIAEVTQNLWKSPRKISLNINDENLDFLDSIIIHILAVQTGNSDN